ncbi:hypothetical protein EVAR_23756_1 [Eumeta japonica]|uniref:Uncharacterized protein n=1 Tax=Eumeta variegata TaxID=151549 RepID=A0A4C1VHE4_EUMVA|nr:hypothetical protein EVAR_23756_1 [Eumeta japonica]
MPSKAPLTNGNLTLVSHSSSGRPLVWDIEATKEAVENQLSTSTCRLSDFLGSFQDTIHLYLRSMANECPIEYVVVELDGQFWILSLKESYSCLRFDGFYVIRIMENRALICSAKAVSKTSCSVNSQCLSFSSSHKPPCEIMLHELQLRHFVVEVKLAIGRVMKLPFPAPPRLARGLEAPAITL